MDLDGGVNSARRGAANEQGHVEAFALKLGGDEAHFIQRRRDEAGQADDVDLLLARNVENLGGGSHHAEVYHFVIVALEHDADDVLADVVNVALHSRHQHLAGLLALACRVQLHVGHENCDSLLHHAC